MKGKAQWESAKVNGREPKYCLGLIFHSKLDSFDIQNCGRTACIQPILELKTLPRFSPITSSVRFTS